MNNPNESPKNGFKYRLPFRRGTPIVLDPHRDSPDPTDRGAIGEWLQRRPRPWAVDIFCGAGGLSLGLEDAGFSVIAAADSDPVSTETHAANIQGLTWTGDLSNPADFIRQLDEWGIESVDLLAGGPPCQPFSRAGTSKIGNLVRSGTRQANDDRADLWRSFFAIVDRLKPRAMLLENVPDFAQVPGRRGAHCTDRRIEESGVRRPSGRAGSLALSGSAASVSTLRGRDHRGRQFPVAQAHHTAAADCRPGHRRPAGGAGR